MGQKLFIPHIGVVLVLTDDWTFNLFFERRNHPLLKALAAGKGCWSGIAPHDWHGDPRYRVEKAMTEEEMKNASLTHRYTRQYDNPYLEITLPTGTPLRVDRIYIKKGVDAYSSLTMVITKECKDKKLRGKRFWAKLYDVNQMFCEPI